MACESAEVEPAHQDNDHRVNDEEKVAENDEHEHHHVEAGVFLCLALDDPIICALLIVNHVAIHLPQKVEKFT